MKLSTNFTLRELIKSSTASRLGINNDPDEETIESLNRLANNILQPVRDNWGSFSTSSGYRSLVLNRTTGSKDTSQHIKGQAADFEVAGVSNYDLAVWIKENLNFDKLILEFYKQGDPNS